MLKSVKFNGFENLPEVRKRIESLMPLVEDVLELSANQISLTWSPDRTPGQVRLEVRDARFGTKTGVVPDGGNERTFGGAVRDVHWNLVHEYLVESIKRREREDALSEGQ